MLIKLSARTHTLLTTHTHTHTHTHTNTHTQPQMCKRTHTLSHRRIGRLEVTHVTLHIGDLPQSRTAHVTFCLSSFPRSLSGTLCAYTLVYTCIYLYALVYTCIYLRVNAHTHAHKCTYACTPPNAHPHTQGPPPLSDPTQPWAACWSTSQPSHLTLLLMSF